METGLLKHEGEPWTIGELALCFLVRKSKESRTILSRLLGRTEDAIDWAWRWCDGARFPEKSGNRIEDHVALVLAVLGQEARGLIAGLPSRPAASPPTTTVA